MVDVLEPAAQTYRYQWAQMGIDGHCESEFAAAERISRMDDDALEMIGAVP